MERRLVSILAVDAASYSRLVASDEDAALVLFREHSKRMTALFNEFNGRQFGGAGDSLVAEFASPVEALRCAVKIQEHLADANGEVVEERRMHFRIGLNLGDAVVVDGNLFGEAVNVAARLEGLAEPGGICISGSFHEQVKHLPEFEFHDLGARTLKNIPFPVHAYVAKGINTRHVRRPMIPWGRIAAAGAAALIALAIGWKYLPYAPSVAPSQPSIAVLPLENLSGDKSQDYFSDGLTQDITTDLSKFSDLFVVASNSAFTYKDKPSKVQDIGSALGVRYLLEGTVQKTPDRLRINAQLINAMTGNHVWAERYDKQLGEVFAVQEDIIQRVVTALAVKVSAAEQHRVSQKETKNMDAYDNYLRAKMVLYDPNKVTKEGNAEVRAHLEKANSLDPNFSMPFGLLSYTYVREFQNAWSEDRDNCAQKGRGVCQEGTRRLPMTLTGIGRWRPSTGIRGSSTKVSASTKRQPSSIQMIRTWLPKWARRWSMAGEPVQAIDKIKGAISRNPETPYWYWWNLGRAYYMAKQYKNAVDAIAKISDPPLDVLLITAASKAQLGNLEAAKSDMAGKSAKYDPEWSIAKSADLFLPQRQ